MCLLVADGEPAHPGHVPPRQPSLCIGNSELRSPAHPLHGLPEVGIAAIAIVEAEREVKHRLALSLLDREVVEAHGFGQIS